MAVSALLAPRGTTMSPPESIGLSPLAVQPLSDEALLRRCAGGDVRALQELTRRYQAPLYRFLARMMDSDDDAEEGVQDVFVRAWRNASRFQYRAKVGTWLYRIAVNIARDAHSRKKVRPREVWLESTELRHLSLDSAEDDALRNVEREDRTVALKRAMNRLGPDDRLILALYYLEDREYGEIQEITGLSYTVLKTRLARARRRLRDRMEAELEKVDS